MVQPKFVIAALIAVMSALPLRAGLYSPDEAPPFEIKDQDMAEPLPWSTFRLILSEISALDVPKSSQRATVEKRIAERMSRDANALSAEELAGLTHDLIRLRRLEDALNILQPLTRDRSRAGFLVLTHMARIHQSRHEWAESYEQQYSAVRDYPFPDKFKNYTVQQLNWLKRVETDYYLPFLRARRDEARQKRVNLSETVDALFPHPEKGVSRPPVRFIAETGVFEPGAPLAANEKAKLPRDAIAIVQQIFLWAPEDSRLFWLLGELYNANGDIAAAGEIFDRCVDDPRNYSSPELMEHRSKVREAIARQQDEQRRKAEAEAKALADERAAERRQFVIAGVLGGAILLFLAYWQLRELARRLRRRAVK